MFYIVALCVIVGAVCGFVLYPRARKVEAKVEAKVETKAADVKKAVDDVKKDL